MYAMSILVKPVSYAISLEEQWRKQLNGQIQFVSYVLAAMVRHGEYSACHVSKFERGILVSPPRVTAFVL